GRGRGARPLRMWCDEDMQARRVQERRRSRRVKIGQPLKVVPTDPSGSIREDFGTTRNVSREGFYFLSKKSGYQEGMRLFVTLPFHKPGDLRNHEHLGQVIRVDAMESGEWGVAVEVFLGGGGGGRGNGEVWGKGGKEKRKKDKEES